MTKIIAIASLKGGVGKSTLAANAACALLSASRRVILVDADEHEALSWWSRRRPPSPVPVVTAPYGQGGSTWAKSVSALDADLIVVDVGGGQTQAVTVGMALADLVVIPVPPTAVDVKVARDTVALLHAVRKRRAGLPPALLVPNRVDRRRTAGREIEAALHSLKEPVAPALMERAAVADAFGETTWIGAYAPRSFGHIELAAVVAIIERVLYGETHPKRAGRGQHRAAP